MKRKRKLNSTFDLLTGSREQIEQITFCLANSKGNDDQFPYKRGKATLNR